MGFRRFADRDGVHWEVRDPSDFEWEIQPVSDPSRRAVRVPAPGHQKDPFELSEAELQRMLDDAGGGRGGGGGTPPAPKKKSPFLD